MLFVGELFFFITLNQPTLFWSHPAARLDTDFSNDHRASPPLILAQAKTVLYLNFKQSKAAAQLTELHARGLRECVAAAAAAAAVPWSIQSNIAKTLAPTALRCSELHCPA